MRNFLAILAVAVVAISAAAESPTPEKTVYDVLRAHGLPIGLVPRGVKEFQIDGNGKFQLKLEHSCSARFENEVHYDSNITGTISYGRIEEISGITAQELFLWFPVRGIRVDIPSSGLIYFDVGVIFKQFSLSLFETPPDCNANLASDDLRGGREIAFAMDEEGSRRTATQ